MPIHDWSRVDANLFHHFHQAWTVAIGDALNAGLLSSPLSALIEPREDIHTSEQMVRSNRVVVRHRLRKAVCVLEVVSPGNKSGKAALRSFVDKSIECLRQGINLLVIDLLPPTGRDPQGIHKAIWDEIEEEPYEHPDKPLTLAAYVAGDLMAGREITAYVEPIATGDRLPDMPAYLDGSVYVPVPLEATYQETWTKCPADMREWVEKGELPE